MSQFCSRRALLSALSAGVAQAFQKTPAHPANRPGSEVIRYADAATENVVNRLTSLDTSSFLPASQNRSVAVKGRFLVFSSDRSGTFCPFRFDLRNGQLTQLAESQHCRPTSLSLDLPARTLSWLDGEVLRQYSFASRKLQTVAEGVEQFSLGASPQEMTVVSRGQLLRLGQSQALLSNVCWSQIKPDGSACVAARGSAEQLEELWLVPLSPGAKPALLLQGPFSNPCWAPGGSSVLFIRDRALHEKVPESSREQRLGLTSPIAAFSPNPDNSVFVTAIASKAQPTINLLLRQPAREFTLCEHRAKNPSACAPIFSGDSRRVYFNSDFQGKPAIYSINVESLIEETAG